MVIWFGLGLLGGLGGQGMGLGRGRMPSSGALSSKKSRFRWQAGLFSFGLFRAGLSAGLRPTDRPTDRVEAEADQPTDRPTDRVQAETDRPIDRPTDRLTEPRRRQPNQNQ